MIQPTAAQRALFRSCSIALLAMAAWVGLAAWAADDVVRVPVVIHAASVPDAEMPPADRDLGRHGAPVWTGNQGTDRRDVAPALGTVRTVRTGIWLEGAPRGARARVASAVSTPLFLAHCALLC